MLPKSLRKIVEEQHLSIPPYCFPASSILPQLQPDFFLSSVLALSLLFSSTATRHDLDSPPIVKHVRVCACLINSIRLMSYLSAIGHTRLWGCKGIELEMSCVTLWRLMYTTESLTTGVPTGRQDGKSRIFCYLWPWHYVLVSHTTIQSSHFTLREVTYRDDVDGISER